MIPLVIDVPACVTYHDLSKTVGIEDNSMRFNRYFASVLGTCCLALVTGCAAQNLGTGGSPTPHDSTKTPPTVESSPTPVVRLHTIREGDTISAIAKEYNVRLEDLVWVNRTTFAGDFPANSLLII